MMKGISWIFEKRFKKYPLHMKSCVEDPKTEKYFGFSKMDKKNVQNWVAENLLTDEIFCLDNEKLSSEIKPKNFFLL